MLVGVGYPFYFLSYGNPCAMPGHAQWKVSFRCNLLATHAHLEATGLHGGIQDAFVVFDV